MPSQASSLIGCLALLAAAHTFQAQAPAAQLPASEAISFPAPPRLATTAADLEKLKRTSGFAARRDQVLLAADLLLKKPAQVPAGPGDWVFYYACSDDGADLRALHEKEGKEHVCPRCKKVYQDERTVAAYRTLLHDRANEAALQLGWAYAYSGDARYAQEVQRILLKLADDYATYPSRRDRWGRTGLLAWLGGRRYSQSLDEAVGVIKLAKAYDLTRMSPVWKDAQRRHVEEDFFRATTATLLFANQGINNHQTWYNAGLMACASVLGDKDLVHKVLTMKGGFRDQLARSLGKDGVWYEGAMAYHNYALQAMIEIVDAGRRLGLPLHEEAAFRRLLEAPLKMTYPNGQFPALNDSDYAFVHSFAGSFRWAWETYGEERFAQALARGDPKQLAALLGPGAKPKPYLETRSLNLEDIGLAILRRGTGDHAACVMIDHGPHGGSHGHYDKLNIVLFAAGQEWLLDPGRLTYSHKEYKSWVKHTAAHNTVTLGGRSQRGCTGKLLWLRTHAEFAACAAETDQAYPGARLRRYLLLADKLLVDLFEVEAADETQIDCFAHALSQQVQPVMGDKFGLTVLRAATPGTDHGYQHLTAARAWTSGPSAWDFVAASNKRLRVWFAGPAQEQVIACTGIGYHIDQKVPCLIRRVHSRHARFAAVYDLTGTGDYVSGLRLEKDNVLTISTPTGTSQVRFEPAAVTLQQASHGSK